MNQEKPCWGKGWGFWSYIMVEMGICFDVEAKGRGRCQQNGWIGSRKAEATWTGCVVADRGTARWMRQDLRLGVLGYQWLHIYALTKGSEHGRRVGGARCWQKGQERDACGGEMIWKEFRELGRYRNNETLRETKVSSMVVRGNKGQRGPMVRIKEQEQISWILSHVIL